MEKIFEINFFYIGIQEKESKKFDYYDLIKPGVAVLFGVGEPQKFITPRKKKIKI